MQNRGKRVLAALLLPAFIAGTFPQTACICADGHRETACPAMSRPASPSAKSECCAKSCCREKFKGGTPACDGNGCQSSASSNAGSTSLATKAGSCCHKVFESPPPAVSAKKSDTVFQVTMAFAEVPSTLLPAAQLWPVFTLTSFSTPPPLDAVIVFSRLTI
jgi:hypothetical protein